MEDRIRRRDDVARCRSRGEAARCKRRAKPIRNEIENWKPDVVLTLLEEFHGEAIYDQNVASYLELMRIPIRAAIRAA